MFKYPTANQVKATDGSKSYNVAITAEVKQISSNLGGENGNRLTISGLGFGNQPENAQVTVDSIPCTIKQIKNDEIICDLDPTPTPTSGPFIQGQGLLLTKYNLMPTGSLTQEIELEDAKQLKTLINNNTIEPERVEFEHQIGSWESIYGNGEDDHREAIFARGFFKAPLTGPYKFYLSASETAAFYLNQTPNTPSIQDSDLLLFRCEASYQKEYFYKSDCGGMMETPITLQEGELYWIELYSENDDGRGHFTLSVEAPEPIDGQYWPNSFDEIQEIQFQTNKDLQRWSIKMFNTEEKIRFFCKYKNPSTQKYELEYNSYERRWYDWNDASVKNDFRACTKYKSHVEVIETHDLDESGNRCTGCTAKGKEIVFEFLSYKEGIYNAPITCSHDSTNCIVSKL